MKKKLRQHVRAVLAGFSDHQLRLQSELIVQRLVALAEFERSAVVMNYMPMSQEVDVSGVALAAWSAGKTVLVPRVNVPQHLLEAVQIDSLSQGMHASHYGIAEPLEGPMWAPQQVELVVVPGLAFDRQGRRLGRGAGYYDRFLALKNPNAVACAVAFSQQVLPEVPAFDHDQNVDILVTDQEVLDFRTG